MKRVSSNSFIQAISDNVDGVSVILPMHPQTKQIFEKAGISAKNISPVNPLGYLEFKYLGKHSKAIITDPRGITEETSVMGIPCMTL